MWTYFSSAAIGWNRVERQGSQFCSPAPSSHTLPSASAAFPPSSCKPPLSSHCPSIAPPPIDLDHAIDSCFAENTSTTIALSYAFFPSAHFSTTVVTLAPFPDTPPITTPNATAQTLPSLPHPLQREPSHNPKYAVPHDKYPNTPSSCQTTKKQGSISILPRLPMSISHRPLTSTMLAMS